MVSDQQIASCVESLLSSASSSGGAGAGDTSFATVLRGAEAKLGVDLSHKASFIRDQIDLLLGPRRPPLNPNPPTPAPAPVQQPQPQAVTVVQQPVQPVQMVQQPIQVTLPHPPPPAHLLFQPIPAVRLINVGGGNVAAHVSTGLTGPAGGGALQMGQLPAGAAAGEGFQLGQMGQVPVAIYPPPPLASFRFGAYQPMPGQQAVVVTSQPLVQVSGSPSTDASKESGSGAAKRKRGGPGGLNKICGVSPELQKIVGETAMSRTQIVKMLWAYIRENNLQDPDDKRKIICNDQLRSLFDTDSTDMFKMNKLLSKHIIPLDSFELEARKRRAAEILAAKGENPESSDQSSNSVLVSDELAMFIGIDDKEMTRDDAVKHVLDYAKANQLEDNANATVVCDAKLKELLGCDSVPISGIRDMLVRHFIAES
ncbi:SWIB/MDM2 domain containing protein [Rhynchospora pubera]|uniref:SWIB/MDM2 domain containing protein n=1 Tax=Rhynchospora pubera TaxID=906938 RepID=A0AAV8F4V0_9POAL|nr:SWIB/MDM2 domain containing protein [Rhynchospora pubera]